MSDVLVVGCGLLGTSIGLALRGSGLGDVTVRDLSAEAEQAAVRRGAGRPWDGQEGARLAVVAVPPSATAAELIALQSRDVALTYTHVASVQSHLQAEVERLSPDSSLVVGGHPLAGREVSGPWGAVADLFVGRPWAVCPTPAAAPAAVQAVKELARHCGSEPIETTPAEHDAAVALLSHVPQVTSTALAALLARRAAADPHLSVSLSGPGLADTTRLAASSPALWTEVLAANASQVAPLLRELAGELSEVADVLESDAPGAPEALTRFLERGNAGRRLVPVKRGELAGAFTGVRVELSDAPGELAQLLRDAGDAGVNVEDLRVEHVPGRPQGVVELLVAPGAQERLEESLRAQRWVVFSTDPLSPA